MNQLPASAVCPSRPVRNERGESRREGCLWLEQETLLSPTLSSLLRREEREKTACAYLVRGRNVHSKIGLKEGQLQPTE